MGNVSREEKVEEAVRRMEMLGIHPDTIKQFQNKGKVSRSEPPLGGLFWVEGWDLDRVEQFEENHNALVYLMIRTQTEFGLMDSYLFVSDYPEEWEEDRADILADQVLAYVFNHDAPDCSEYGAIGIEKTLAASVYFARLRTLPQEITPVAICGKAPDWYAGLQYKEYGC